MRRVIVESPFAGQGATPEAAALDAEGKRAYLLEALRDCLARGESPYASHAILVHVLNDDEPHERILGISSGFAWRAAAHATVVYEDLGISSGMRAGIWHAQQLGQAIEYRRIRA